IKNDQGLKQTLEKERIEELLKEQMKTEHQQKVTLVTRISLVIILVLMIILSIIIFIRQKEKFKKKRLEVEFELNESKAKLADLKSKDKEVQAYEDELEELYQNIDKDENQITETQKTLEALLSKPIMTDNKWLVFKRSFDRVNPGYFEKLHQQIPNISQAEI